VSPRLVVLVLVAVGLAPTVASAQRVRDVLGSGTCGGEAPEVAGLARQIASTQSCMYPGSLETFAGGGNLVVRTFLPIAHPAALAALRRGAAGGRLTVNAALRTVAQQYVMRWRWDHAIHGGCVAPPGSSYGAGTHNSGGAFDINEAGSVVGRLSAAGLLWGGNWTRPDPVHYYINAAAHDVRAFQHLWNSNHPEDRIAETGGWNGETEARLLASPAGGFSHDGCAVDHDGDGSPEGEDCDDDDPLRSPRLSERCDDVDNDCDDVVDDYEQVCGTDEGDCRTGIETCTHATWSACVGEIPPVPESCDTRDNDCDAASDEERICEHDDAAQAALLSPRMASDVDGDGRADACIRTPAGFRCLLASATGFDGAVLGPAMADDDGWDERVTYTSVRTGDVDGDGMDDLCARSGDRVVCYRATGVGFAESLVSVPLGDPSPEARTAELWLADVDGDGRLDVCARGVNGLRCQPTARDALVVVSALSDGAGWADVARHGSIRFGDVDGDGRDDVCGRDGEGLVCWLLGDTGPSHAIRGPHWSDADGWSEPRYGSTFRLEDVDGDGRADACARGPTGFACWIADGHGFGQAMRGPRMDDPAWDERSTYATIRIGDVDGDGTRDLCARMPDGVRCWLWSGEALDHVIIGPRLSDAEGWNDAARYTTIRLADVDGDARMDLCARAADGVHCWISGDLGFSHAWRSSAWSDALGLSDPAFGSTFVVAGIAAEHVPPPAGCACSAPSRRPSGAWTACALALLFVGRGRRRRSLSRSRA
jgi:hypothetical protein